MKTLLRCGAWAVWGLPTAMGVVSAQVAPSEMPTSAAIWIVSSRYASASDVALLVGRIAPHWVIVSELTADVHSTDWSLGLAAGLQLSIAGAHLIVVVGPLVSNGIWYAGMYAAPSITRGRLAVSGTLEAFQPVTADAHFVFEISHARVLGRVAGRIQAGAFFQLTESGGQVARDELGPSLRVGVARGLTVTADAAHGFQNTPSEIVLSAQWAM